MTINEKRSYLLNNSLPNHVAIILDGNGRWAKIRNLPRTTGHAEGMKRLKEIVEESIKLKIKNLSLFCFSTENFKRDINEVNYLMNLFKLNINQLLNKKSNTNYSIRICGSLDNLSEDLINLIKQVNNRFNSSANTIINICFNYGSRDEIIRAIKKIDNFDNLNSDNFKNYLDIKEDVDFLIRTSGEERISNFLLYQASYAEIYFTNTLFPDFTIDEYLDSLIEYTKRDRRFGGIK